MVVVGVALLGGLAVASAASFNFMQIAIGIIAILALVFIWFGLTRILHIRW